jgi:hypothetical protein
MFDPYHFSIESWTDGRKMVARKIGKFDAPPSFFLFPLSSLTHYFSSDRDDNDARKGKIRSVR